MRTVSHRRSLAALLDRQLTCFPTIAQLAGNPHITRPSRADLQPGPAKVDSTTFAPPPPSFPRSLYVPPALPSVAAPSSAGQFNMSLRGARKELRRMMGQHTSSSASAEKAADGGRVQELLDIMESELREWCARSGKVDPAYYHSSPLGALGHGGRVLDSTPVDLGWSIPSPAPPSLPDLPHQPSSSPSQPPPSLTELSRTPQQLVWLIPSPHSRYLAHLLARYYSLQSFSRPLSPLEPSIRVTHIVRAQLAAPLRGVAGGMQGMGMDTPPGTDWSDVGATTGVDTTSGSEVDMASRAPSEFSSDAEFDSEASDYEDARGRPARPPGTLRLGEEIIIRSSIPSYTPSDFESEEGGTGDERSSFASDSSDAEADEEGGMDSLASSFADLRSMTSAEGSPPRAPFSAVPSSLAQDDGASTPRPLPLRQRLPRESFPPPSSPSAATPRPSARDTSPDFSLSRSRDASPIRAPAFAPVGPSMGGAAPREQPVPMGRGAPRAQEWTMPEKRFVEWLFA